jgi:hypothetical protein
METTGNKETEIKEIPLFTIASYAIHYNIRYMIAHIH